MLRLLMTLAAAGVLAGTAITRADAAELVYVFEPGCPYCRLWDREIAPVYPKTSEATRAPLQAVDRHDPALASLRLVSPVRYTPTFVLVENGAELGRIEGYPGEDFFWGRLAALLERLPAVTQ
jgi:thiol-disulfide isomerase/thioredoxin